MSWSFAPERITERAAGSVAPDVPSQGMQGYCGTLAWKLQARVGVLQGAPMRSLVYSLEFELERMCPRTTQCLIVPVDPEGQSPYCHAQDRSKRLVDLVAGDWIVHNRHRYRVKTVVPFRSRKVANDFRGSQDGYMRDA
jgi:hypothetical protein